MALKITAFFAILLSIFIYYHKRLGFDFTFLNAGNANDNRVADRLFTSAELIGYNGVDSELMFLSILGNVYDVTSGKRHYGPDSDYNIFIGRDASKSFITGEFSNSQKDLDDVLDLALNDLLGLDNWKKMYDKQYIYKGKLIGRFYDSSGYETVYTKKVYEKINEAIRLKLLEEKKNQQLPPCNSEWSMDYGTRVWCTKKSGGIDRDWEGVPRLLYTPGSSESVCVCARNKEYADNNSNLKQYDNCDPFSLYCDVPNTAG